MHMHTMKQQISFATIVFTAHCITYLTVGHEQECFFSDGWIPGHCSGYGALLDSL